VNAHQIIALEIEREALMDGSAAALPGHERQARIQQINEQLRIVWIDYRKAQEMRSRASLAADWTDE
jgi:hypothetical protein